MMQSRQKALEDLQSLQNDKVCDVYMILVILYSSFIASLFTYPEPLNQLVQIFCQLEKLSDIQNQPESQLKFIIEAWLQVLPHY
jgi:hypothetical protein